MLTTRIEQSTYFVSRRLALRSTITLRLRTDSYSRLGGLSIRSANAPVGRSVGLSSLADRDNPHHDHKLTVNWFWMWVRTTAASVCEAVVEQPLQLQAVHQRDETAGRDVGFDR